MMNDMEKLLAAAKNGELSEAQKKSLSESLMKSLSDNQRGLLESVTKDRGSLEQFMNTPAVKKLLGEE